MRVSWSPSHRLGVRGRTTLIATAVVGVVLAVSGVLLVIATRSALYQAVETTVTARAADLALQLDGGVAPQRLPLVRGISVQIVREGVVVSSTEDIEGQRQIVEVAGAAAPGQIVTTQVPALDVAENEGEGHDDEDGEGPYLVAVARTGGASGSVAVVAAGSLGAVDRTHVYAGPADRVRCAGDHPLGWAHGVASCSTCVSPGRSHG